MKKNKYLKVILIIIVLIYISSYYIANSSYYEYSMQRKTILTNEKIKEFELDIKNNENVDIKKYLNSTIDDYSNNFTNLIYNTSNKSNKVFKKGIIYLFKKLNSLIEE